MSAAHTPTPWQAKHLDRNHQVISGTDGMFVGGHFRTETGDAAHIVRCVNAHDELVAALRKLVAASDALGEAMFYGDDEDDDVVSAKEDANVALDKARAALAKVDS